MNFWDSILVAGKMSILLLDGVLSAVFVLLAVTATALLFSILPRKEARPSGRLLAVIFLFSASRSAVSMAYIPGVGPWLWLLAPAVVLVAWWWESKRAHQNQAVVFDHTLGCVIWIWGALWTVSNGAALFVHGVELAWLVLPLALVGGWIVARVLTQLWRELTADPIKEEAS